MVEKYSTNPLLFWQDSAVNYPVLQQLATLFLGMSAGSVPVECLFSITGLITNGKCSSLCPLKVNKISFLQDGFTDFCIKDKFMSARCKFCREKTTITDKVGTMSNFVKRLQRMQWMHPER